jgi:hypothetical protein
MTLRKILRNRRSFPTDDSALIALNFYGGFPLELVEETHWLRFLGSLADDFGVAITITVGLCAGFHLNELSGFFGMLLAAFCLRGTLLFSPIFLSFLFSQILAGSAFCTLVPL